MRVAREFAALAAANLLFWTGFSVYYVASRRVIEAELGEAYSFAVLVTGVEEAPLLASIVLGAAADYLGRRRVLVFGFIEAVSVAVLAFLPVDVWLVPVALAALAFSLAYSSLMGMVLEYSSGSGFRYSMIAAFGSAGWALGGLVGGAALEALWRYSFLVSGLLLAAGYLVAMVWGPSSVSGGFRASDLVAALRHVAVPVIAIIAGGAGLSIFYGAASVRLSSIVESDLLYGALLTTLPATLGALVRPVAGRVSDAVGHERLFSVTNAAYAMEAFIFAYTTSSIVLALAWAAPIYPFRDVALSLMVSTRMPARLQATAAGVINFSGSVSGLIAAFSSPLYNSSSIAAPMMAASLLLLASNVVLLVLALHASTPRARSPASPRPGTIKNLSSSSGSTARV